MLTTAEFENLKGMPKVFKEQTAIMLGPAPIRWSREIVSNEFKQIFLLDYRRGSIELSKFTYNKRYHSNIVLSRYDSEGRHTNPDGEMFDGPHVHIYKEGYEDKFAYPISALGISEENACSMGEVLKALTNYFNIQNLPEIQNTFI